MCFSPLNRICHWGPLTALSIIKLVTGMTVHCSSMWWPPQHSIGGFLNTLCFMSLSGLTLYNFLSAMFHGPGCVPADWTPTNQQDTEFLQWCKVCSSYKAPRSHHCRKCGKCILKMDHHCPWINNCVGWGNQAHFTAFLACAVSGCAHASIILGCSLYRGLNRVWYMYYGLGHEPIVHLNIYTLILGVFALGQAVGVVLAVGMLLFFQVRAIVRNRTGIEDWILEKAIHRRSATTETFVFPYDMGAIANVRQVLNASCQPTGDGIAWSVLQDCDQYTLTREQIVQKNEKRRRTRLYKVVREASGSWVPLAHGCSTCLHPPFTDEPRIRLHIGDQVNVTRWRKYWLFGEKVDALNKDIVVRGWFPRCCANEVTDFTTSINNFSRNNKKQI